MFREIPIRQPRGSYAKLICLNCRSRKIKCSLPEHVEIEASQTPQPPDRACMRCQQQGLDCVVDRTVLGRPSQKRRRPEHAKIEDCGPGEESVSKNPEYDDPDVQDFVLSDLRAEVNDIDSLLSLPSRAKPSKREVFEALMDSTHLFSALMSRDARFGSRAFGLPVDASIDLTEILNEELTTSLNNR